MAKELDAAGWPVMSSPYNSPLVSNFDRLVEQQDQEIFHYGCVSPATQAALENLTEQDYLPSPAPKKDYSWLRRAKARDHDWDDWE